MCTWNTYLVWGTCASFAIIILTLSIVIINKIRGKNNQFVILFAAMVTAAMLLEVFSFYPKTNYALRWVEIYYYVSVDATTISSF